MEPVAWLITYGERHQLRVVVLDHARAVQMAADLRGTVEALFTAPPGARSGVNQGQTAPDNSRCGPHDP